MLLPNGSAIKQDVIDCFNKAVGSKENWNDNGSMNWNFVDADMHIELSKFYASDYIYECLNVLADNYGKGWV